VSTKRVNRAYVDGSLSLGEVAKMFEKRYVEMRDWLQKKGIDPASVLDEEIETQQEQNINKALHILE